MDRHVISFRAKQQGLECTNGFARFASGTEGYIYARFVLDDLWQSFDSVKAVWANDEKKYEQTITHDTEAAVPAGVLGRRSGVEVNLVGYAVDGGVTTQILTTYPCLALVIDRTALTEGE